MATAEQEVQQGAGTALVAAPSRSVGLLRPVAPVGDIIAAQEETREFIAKALKVGRDYGVIPGTDKKNNLLKPGAERVCAGFGVRPEFDLVESEVDHDREVPWKKAKKVWRNEHKGDKRFDWQETTGHSTGLYRFVVRCLMIHTESGTVVGSGIGSCSSMESKYVDRPRESENTILKMAKKRAFVDATLTTFGLSDAFTQDLEDAPRDIETTEGEVTHSEPFASIERVKEVRAELVALGATKAWLRGFDQATQEPQTESYLLGAVEFMKGKKAEREAAASQNAGPAPEAQPAQPTQGEAPADLFERREAPAEPVGVVSGEWDNDDDLPF